MKQGQAEGGFLGKAPSPVGSQVSRMKATHRGGWGCVDRHLPAASPYPQLGRAHRCSATTPSHRWRPQNPAGSARTRRDSGPPARPRRQTHPSPQCLSGPAGGRAPPHSEGSLWNPRIRETDTSPGRAPGNQSPHVCDPVPAREAGCGR